MRIEKKLELKTSVQVYTIYAGPHKMEGNPHQHFADLVRHLAKTNEEGEVTMRDRYEETFWGNSTDEAILKAIQFVLTAERIEHQFRGG